MSGPSFGERWAARATWGPPLVFVLRDDWSGNDLFVNVIKPPQGWRAVGAG